MADSKHWGARSTHPTMHARHITKGMPLTAALKQLVWSLPDRPRARRSKQREEGQTSTKHTAASTERDTYSIRAPTLERSRQRERDRERKKEREREREGKAMKLNS